MFHWTIFRITYLLFVEFTCVCRQPFTFVALGCNSTLVWMIISAFVSCLFCAKVLFRLDKVKNFRKNYFLWITFVCNSSKLWVWIRSDCWVTTFNCCNACELTPKLVHVGALYKMINWIYLARRNYDPYT